MVSRILRILIQHWHKKKNFFDWKFASKILNSTKKNSFTFTGRKSTPIRFFFPFISLHLPLIETKIFKPTYQPDSWTLVERNQILLSILQTLLSYMRQVFVPVTNRKDVSWNKMCHTFSWSLRKNCRLTRSNWRAFVIFGPLFI